MPMASEDPLPKAIDFLNLCERCHKTCGDVWLVNGDYICDECHKNTKLTTSIYSHKHTQISYQFSLVKKDIRAWTKWYGVNEGVSLISEEWYCQACTEKQTIELPSYLIRIESNEYARICSKCLNLALNKKINNLYTLQDIVKPLCPDF